MTENEYNTNHGLLTTTRGGLVDPVDALFSFSKAALFWLRIYKIPHGKERNSDKQSQHKWIMTFPTQQT